MTKATVTKETVTKERAARREKKRGRNKEEDNQTSVRNHRIDCGGNCVPIVEDKFTSWRQDTAPKVVSKPLFIEIVEKQICVL